MDLEWREKLIIHNLLRGILSEFEEEKSSSQVGAGVSPENTVFKWKMIPYEDGVEVGEIYWKKFKRHELKGKFEITHNFGAFSDLFQIEKNIDQMFAQFMNTQLLNFDENDRVSVKINHSQLNGRYLYIPPFKKKNFNEESFFNALYEVAQSNASFLITGEMLLEVNVMKAIVGSGKTAKAPITNEEKLNNARSVVEVKNDDNGCAFYAITIAIKKIEIPKSDVYEWQCIRRNTNKMQEIFAYELAKKCGFDLKKPIGIDDFKKIQTKLNYQLIVVDGKNKYNRLFVGEPIRNEKIYILHREKLLNKFHYDAIVNIKGFMGQKFYCFHCHKPYSHIHQHFCNFICDSCHCYPLCVKTSVKILCEKCKKEFYGDNCYKNHLQGANNVCKNVKKCINCLQIYFSGKHECDTKICKICYSSYKLEKHYCFLKTINPQKLIDEDKCEKIIVAYDIESQQKETDKNLFLHIPDLLISMTTCNKCWIESETRRDNECELCGQYNRIFFGTDCIKKFGDYIYFDLARRGQEIGAQIYIFAHNAKGYDNHFILNDLYQRNFEETKVIMCGNKILKASVGNVKFLDSLLMFQQPLAALPKAFGFENIVKKGYFPHLFHTQNQIDYNGPLPSRESFGTEFMKSKQLRDFEEWYTIENERLIRDNLTYNLKNELIKYCENDVLILLNCIQVFRKIYREVTDIDPITRCFTLASMGLEIFKAKILPDSQIGVTPIKGYGARGCTSHIANSWLDYQSKLIDCEMLREINIDSYVVDGFAKEINTVYEYNGCYHHCHEHVYKNSRDVPLPQKKFQTPNQIYEYSQNKARHLRKRGFIVEEEWDCTLVKKRKLDPRLDSYIEQRYEYYQLLEELGGVDIRESFFGGRTNNIRFWCDVTDDISSRILYYDFRSLYPTVLKYKDFPIGHPKVINENFDEEINNYFGFIKCILDPPEQLYIPVLPLKTKKKKLIFPLCTMCAESQNPRTCEHTIEERRLIGTWTTIELSYAIEKGYKIHKIIEVYHYIDKTKNIFSEYINLWLKFKQQSDGWPSWVKNDDDKLQYINNFEEREGVKMNIEEIEKNPGLRFIAKLFLNTLWGKLAQRPNLQQTKVCTEYKDYWEIVNDEEKVIKGELMVNDNCLLLNWEYKEVDTAKNGNTSLAIASFVTSYARIELMKKLDEIEIIPGRVLYFDTDSIIFRYKDGEPKPSTDDYLGGLADEISKDYGEKAVCTKFCSLGPKVYAMEIWPENSIQPIVPIKVKGITLTDKALDIIKMKSMLELAEDYVKQKGKSSETNVLKIPQMQIRPTNLQTIETKTFEKTFRAMSEKRRLSGNDTLPFGYVDWTKSDFMDLIIDI